jgi:hypothetical protein
MGENLPRLHGLLRSALQLLAGAVWLLPLLISSPEAIAGGGALPRITGFSPGAGLPFTVLTIRGAQFNPKAKFKITFSDGQAFSVAEPALVANKHEIQAALPPYFDRSGNLTSGTLSIQVTVTPKSGTPVSSNILSGLKIEAPPASSLPAGSYMLTTLHAALLADTDLQTTLIGTAIGTPDVLNELGAQVTNLNTLIADVQAVINGTSSGFVIATHNGANVVLNRTSLAAGDRIVLSLLNQLAQPIPKPAAPDLAAMGSPEAARSASNAIQLAAEAAVAATTVPLLNTATAQLAAGAASYAAAHPCDAAEALVFAGGVVATVASLPSLPEIALTTYLAIYSGVFVDLGALFEPVELLSLKSLSAIAGGAVAGGCTAAEKGTAAGIQKVATDAVKGLVLAPVWGGEIIAKALDGNDLLSRTKLKPSFLGEPDPGVYSERCTATTEPTSCCAGNSCSTVPGQSASVSFTVDVTNPASLTSSFCPPLVGALDSSGCGGASCGLQAMSFKTFTMGASCTIPPQPGCGPLVLHELCTFALQ